MTLSATAAVNRYVAAEGQLTFPFTFKLLDTSHLDVFVGTEVVVSGYMVSGVGNDTGGNVTFTSAAAPRAAGEPSVIVTLRRSVPLDQVVDLPAQGSISSVSLEESGLDRIVMILQQLAEVDERSLKVSVDSSLCGNDTELVPAGSQLLGFNADASALATYAMGALTASIVPTTLMENLLGDATIADALITLGLANLSPAASETGKVPISSGSGAYAFADPPMFRNLVINGDMAVKQRTNAQIAGLGAASKSVLDMWRLISAGSSPQARIDFTQDTATAPAGHAFAMKMTCVTAETDVASDEVLAVGQRIEASRLQHLLYGQSGARTLVLSFWMRSPKAGTHCLALLQPDGGRAFVREFTVAVADTWERFVVTIPGDTAGMIHNDTGAGLEVVFPLAAGGDHQAAADQWAGGTAYATSNQQNLLDNASNVIGLAGVQLEVGTQATAFEHLPVAVTEDLCARYYEQWRAGTGGRYLIGQCFASTKAIFALSYKPKRASPTIGYAPVTYFDLSNATNNGIEATQLSISSVTQRSATIEAHIASGLTAGHATQLKDDGGNNSYFEIDAEL